MKFVRSLHGSARDESGAPTANSRLEPTARSLRELRGGSVAASFYGPGSKSAILMKPELAPDSVLEQTRSVIERLCSDGSAMARVDGSVHTLFPVAASPAEGEALRSWVVRERATKTIEIGLGYGISALFMCEGLLLNGNADARHVAIDPFQATRFRDCGLQFLDEAGLRPMVEHHAEESQIALPRFLADGRSFDLAFVDGNHRFDVVFLDLYYLGRLLPRGGIVILDDYQLPGIARAASFFVANLGWQLVEVMEPDHHWAVLRTSRHEDSRDYWHFAEF